MRVVLTGGPHSGKSTLLSALAERGIRVVPEAALIEIEGLVATLGAEHTRVWRRDNPTEFQLRVARRQQLAEQALDDDDNPPSLVILDRGLIDGLAYCEFRGIAVPHELAVLARASRYDLAIVCALIEPFDGRAASGRTNNDEDNARRLGAMLADVYLALGVPIRCLPAMPLEQRVAAVLALVEAHRCRVFVVGGRDAW